MSSTSISLENFLNNCQTGDILLYNSNYWYSRCIEYVTGSLYSHIAIILRDPVYINPKLKGLYVLESSKENICDSNLEKKIIGVQIIPLKHVLEEYKNSYIGNLYYRKLDANKNESFISKLTECINHTEGDIYDLNPLDWLKAGCNINIGNVQKENTFWCSALVSYVYSKLGFLDSNIPWTIIPPRKFSYYENDSLTYYNCTLQPEVLIDLSSN
tara:strand:- start:7096 stop:7737 length:642 start_codon:yes stop_codon:yes gene_type:complete